ncbi:MAG: hypothetical protein A2W86_12985 [Bacteroidetes bacterium GWD2_45_23]|nr:MAG: hypothetical protein A2W87_09370 [Bacteroidetes bacterium GWC2_46_850]OFX74563.1 MAG: hypothetical protein A2071_01250 [Bacteroidetes bacterium GWC1_47_7]OFX82704.1 MAG: hypothetical protein A2W86_12985 [Bacteroidetes bacterium GWD2_45_23]HAR39393.1 hypothetical protein [Porphyromonadaceae bacterium]HBB02008.1 hypothetical protein [Porphyromonadaceae bacterium]
MVFALNRQFWLIIPTNKLNVFVMAKIFFMVGLCNYTTPGSRPFFRLNILPFQNFMFHLFEYFQIGGIASFHKKQYLFYSKLI